MKKLEKIEAIKLRKNGESLREISVKLNVSQSTVSVWVKDVKLSDNAKKVLKLKITDGQLKSHAILRTKRLGRLKLDEDFAKKSFKNTKLNRDTKLLICAMIYWCEGTKSDYQPMMFTNSDPELIRKFLELLRGSFDLDESKFRVGVHLHEYHDINKQLKFWSKTTNIPLRQFIKPFIKDNSGSRTRESYPGCASIRYQDVTITRKLNYLAKLFIQKGSIG